MIDILEAKKQTPLIDSHNEIGVILKEYFGWQMPALYKNIEKEVWSVRNSVGVVDLSFHGVVKISGKEGAKFLHGMVTNDVLSLSKGKGMRAAFLTGHGKVKAFCLIFSFGEEYFIINDPQTHDKIYNYVTPFSFAGDFQVEDVSETHRIISLQGPNSLQVLREVCFEPIPDLQEYEWVYTIVAGHKVIISRHTRTSEVGYDLFVSEKSIGDVWDFLLLKGQFHSLSPFGLDALEVLRIEAGIPVYGVDIDESNMILEAGLDDAVSYHKGCYTGQEAVAMATYRGHVSKKLSGLVFDEDVEINHGDKIFKDGIVLGFISSSAKSEILKKKIGLGCIKYGFYTPGENVEIVTPDITVEATIVQLPFV